MTRVQTLATLLALVVCAVGCGGDDSQEDVDATMPDAGSDAGPDGPPQTLLESGLWTDIAAETLAEGVLAYQPAYVLWSDGARKRRWVYLPPDAVIDTSEMDFWSYPEGTKAWKEFAIDGKKLETRLLFKMGPLISDWYHVSFQWNADGTEAVAAPEGANNVLGTQHDIPDQADCRKCHIRQPDYMIGFSALQLAHQKKGVNLGSLVADGRLSDEPGGEAPYLVIPGVAVERKALGYLHANCGGCHHRDSDVMDTAAVNLRLEVDSLATVEDTVIYKTSVGVKNQLQLPGVKSVIEPGDPASSSIYVRMQERATAAQMPPVGTEVVDDDGMAVIEAWIDHLGMAATGDL